MAEWCDNVITIRATNDAQRNRLDDILRAAEEERLLNFLYPIPKEVEIERDWRLSSWNTKWEAAFVSGEIEGDTLDLVIETAYTPPLPPLGNLMEEGFEVVLYYQSVSERFVGIFEDFDDRDYSDDEITVEWLEASDDGRRINSIFDLTGGDWFDDEDEEE